MMDARNHAADVAGPGIVPPTLNDVARVADQAPYALPAFVGAVERYTSVVEIGACRVNVVGLAVTVDGRTVTGAAAELGSVPHARSHFELLERLAVLEASPVETTGNPLQRLSISNGAALHEDPARARLSAALELVERDRVLRSWYGGQRPTPIERALPAWCQELGDYYRLRAYTFDSGVDFALARAEVAGILAFPLDVGAPLSVGFAARETLSDALDAAGRELLQQIAFGWGEPVPREPPEIELTPEFHLDFFAYPGHHGLLEAWLEGEHQGRGPELPGVHGDFRFTDLTPSWMKGLTVTRAEHPAAIPLVFGVGHPWFPDLPDFMRVQPIA